MSLHDGKSPPPGEEGQMSYVVGDGLGSTLATGLSLREDLWPRAVFVPLHSESSHTACSSLGRLSHGLLMIFRVVKWSFPEDKNHSLTLASEPFILLRESLYTMDSIRWG